jgi:hypothetical protein
MAVVFRIELHMTIVLQFYPNGEFSQGVDTSASRRKKKQRRHRIVQRRDADISTQTSRYAQITASIPADKIEAPGTQYKNRRGDILTVLHACDEGVTLAREVNGEGVDAYTTKYSIYDMIDKGDLSPLVYQSVEFCDKHKNRKILDSMTRRMARNIRNAAFLLERQPGGKDVLSFLTLTLPSLSPEGIQACVANWDALSKRFFDWLRVTLTRKGIEFQYVYCTEVQTKRLQERGEYAPHLHIIFRGRNGKKKPWAITPKQARKAWRRCIDSIVDELYDDSALENLQRVRRSAGRYLSKYLSKGAKNVTFGNEELGFTPLRTHWGGMARSLSQSIRRHIIRLDTQGNLRELVLVFLRSMDELLECGLVRHWKAGFIPLGGFDPEGNQRGLHVGTGSLAIAAYSGGVSAVLSYLRSRHAA